MRGRGATSVVASPVLVGAVTVLVVTVSIFLAYNANRGLPFVPTYDLSVRLPSASNLVRGDEVRAAGFRVGVVDSIKPASVVVRGRRVPIAVANVKLDKVVEPLPLDTEVIVRPRSSLGLKYISLTLGRSSRGFQAGATVPLSQATLPVEFDDLLNTFDDPTRAASHGVLAGYGDALAGGGGFFECGFRGAEPVLPLPDARDARAVGPAHGVADAVQERGRGVGAAGACRWGPGFAIRADGGHVRGLQPLPELPSGHDREAAADS